MKEETNVSAFPTSALPVPYPFQVPAPFLSIQSRAAGQEMGTGEAQPTPQLLLTLIVLGSKQDQHTQHPLQGLI